MLKNNFTFYFNKRDRNENLIDKYGRIRTVFASRGLSFYRLEPFLSFVGLRNAIAQSYLMFIPYDVQTANPS